MGELGCNRVWEPRAITELDCLLGTVHRAPLTHISLYSLTIYLSAVCYPGKLGAPGVGCAHVTCPLMECSLTYLNLFNQSCMKRMHALCDSTRSRHFKLSLRWQQARVHSITYESTNPYICILSSYGGYGHLQFLNMALSDMALHVLLEPRQDPSHVAAHHFHLHSSSCCTPKEL